jgi:soluble lytic murein transglycosylase-like protein
MGNKRDKKQKPLIGLALLTAAMALFLLGTGIARAPDAAVACEVAPETAQAQAEPEAQPLDPAQRALVQVLSRRFMIASEATATIVSAAHRAAASAGLDPLLVLAVISIESRFNPLAESSMGAKGLMQIIPRFHRAKLAEHGGDQAVLDPESNIEVGTRILQEYIHRTGTLEAGLQFYNGASRDGSAQYAQKVMAERLRLEDTVRAVLRRASADTASAGG